MNKKEKERMAEYSVSASFLTSNVLSDAIPYEINGHECSYRDDITSCKMFINSDKKECILCLLSKLSKDIKLIKNNLEEKK